METQAQQPIHRLFFSVDLKGSTAYKYLSIANPIPLVSWQELYTSNFYRKFIDELRTEFSKSVLDLKDDLRNRYENINPLFQPIKFIKAIGDEMLFSADVQSCTDAQYLTSLFIKALWKVRQNIAFQSIGNKKISLDLKSTAWLGKINTIDIAVDAEKLFEVQAPTDFIGPSIDIGFRLAKYSTPGKMMLSIELAWALAKAANKNNQINNFNLEFGYDGRTDLKGVEIESGYPLIWLDVYKGYREKFKIQLKYKGEWRLYSPFKAKKILPFIEGYINKQNNNYIKPVGLPR